MDISLARTFLMVAETGSFIETARKLNVTQSTVSARIKSLEAMLGRPLFDRSKLGAALTSSGEQFRKHALALVRVWQHAQLDIGLTKQHRDHLAAGAPQCLWDGLLLRWVAWMRKAIPDIAISASSCQAQVLNQRLVEGTLDLAVMYRPVPPPGLASEHLFDEEFVWVTSGRVTGRRTAADYLSIDWGPEFSFDHAAAYPDLASAGLDYLVDNDGSGYVPLRLVRASLAKGRLKINKRGRRFVYPVYVVYPEARDEEAFEPILQGLRTEAKRAGRSVE
jgi:LysR family transcriptional regulator, flagellar master operon regulator